MVAAKEKPNATLNHVTSDRYMRKSATGITSFKIYAENENAKSHRHTRVISDYSQKSVQSNSKDLQMLSRETDECLKLKDEGKSANLVNAEKRRVLADVSNLQVSLRKQTRDGLCSQKSRNNRRSSLQRATFAPRIQTAFSTARKTSTTSKKLDEKVSGRLREGAGTKNAITASNVHRTSLARKPRKDLHELTRKSLPVLKGTGKSDQSSLKGRDENTENANGNCSNTGKIRPKFKIPARYMGGHCARNRGGAGTIITAPKSKVDVPSQALSKKLVKKSLEDASSNPEKVSKCNQTSRGAGIPAAVLQSRKDEGRTSCFPESSVHGTMRKSSKELHKLFIGDAYAGTRKISSTRRRSFTSQLMMGLKENLPSIDDKGNSLEVSEYVDDIYQYYWDTEAKVADYMEAQDEINAKMRGILINWLIEVHYKFGLMPETLYLTVTLLDRYLSLAGAIKKKELQLVGLAALLLASKYEDFWHPRVKELISISAESYTRDQLIEMEKLVLQTLKFRLNSSTPYVFLMRFLKAAQADTKLENLAFYLIELCLVEYEALNYKASLVCASAIYVARFTLQIRPRWTLLLRTHTRYNESDIRECAEMILRFHKVARTGVFNVTREKYSSPELGRVAEVKPFDKIPL